MIVAGLVLAAVGVADLIRLVRGRSARITLLVVAAVAQVIVGAAIDAVAWALVAVAVAAAWVLVVPADGRGRAGLLPIAVLAIAVTVAVAVAGARPGVRIFDAPVVLPGDIPIDLAVLVAGCAVFLVESANIVVRASLRTEAVRDDTAASAGLKGGRLIGPLERLLVFGLTLVSAYTLLAAVLAAKGIVRFPEISRDAGAGNRAEYFLVGSLVSWTLGVAAAFLVWWGYTPR